MSSSIQSKKILIGVTGGIAAYKVAILIRLLIKQGAEVKVIMTTSALDFITPLTLSTLSKNPVLVDFFDRKSGEWNNHVELGLWADLFLIAPLSANTLAKLAQGQSDNLLVATYLSARCTVMVAPAMDLDMYKHPSVQQNFDTILRHGVTILEAGTGELASGLHGQGRMMEPEEMIDKVSISFRSQMDLKGKVFLITAGPTQEAIDPVRYISNHSSGKMGIAIAHEAAERGAKVHLALGPTNLKIVHPNIDVIPVVSAQDMYEAAKAIHPTACCVVFAAAVADYGPAEVSSQKVKKSGESLTLTLKKNVDIALTLGRSKQEGQIHVGFALETENEQENAIQKLGKKNFDFIVLNSLQDKGAGFKTDTNKVTYFFKDHTSLVSEVLPKREIAKQVVDLIKTHLDKQEQI
ncbi:bifunctional phosphopantothenoylcysteine decarboxylase/phosphopantothenate--cysteine ligase CoaBC [Lunatibacter salilacus]|uniref:bifunctional phosphopantothenoylcysteine decarboxylase/phosphopantothenate--cysteine ligase CoaBC n=1 Tax=Lunatibacter salilacus TaxID=2483804 RepID=UPI00131C2A95|nr:bifunctional phosphopantothenoylcysteine decarboxylase/phosphopantothenate--cysteine ligase CoaBC [Lunatibacter salilacus]